MTTVSLGEAGHIPGRSVQKSAPLPGALLGTKGYLPLAPAVGGHLAQSPQGTWDASSPGAWKAGQRIGTVRGSTYQSKGVGTT